MDKKWFFTLAFVAAFSFGISEAIDEANQTNGIRQLKTKNVSNEDHAIDADQTNGIHQLKTKNVSNEDHATDADHSIVKKSLEPYPKKNDSTGNPSFEAPSFIEKSNPRINNRNPCRGGNCGPPLLLTPMIDSGKIAEAAKMAEVPKNSTLSSVRSYSGFFTVNETIGSHMFFWFFPATEEAYAPIVVRLQGGPGQSALFDIFNGIGPFRLDDRLNLLKNPHTLVRSANLLYFDNPVGTGFSYTTSKDGYPTTQENITDHLYSALSQFLVLFPKQKDNHVYLSGEGYGAKYAMSLAKKIQGLKSNSNINLKGIILGSPFVDPEVIYNSHNYLFEVGILDDPEFAIIDKRLNEARRMANSKNFSMAMDIVEEIFGSPYRIPVNKKYYIPEISGISAQYNCLDVEDPQSYNGFVLFVNQTAVRRAMHVGGVAFQDGRLAYDALRDDILQSSKRDMLTVLKQYNVLIYNGNFDKKTPVSLATEIFETIDWKQRTDFRSHRKMLWKINPGDNGHLPDGYIRKARHYTHIIVLGSGHLVAYDKPAAVYDAINKFIWGQAYYTFRHPV